MRCGAVRCGEVRPEVCEGAANSMPKLEIRNRSFHVSHV